MKIIKGVLTYTLILIGVLVVSGILLVSVMTFLKVDIFGYSFIIGGGKYSYTNSLVTFGAPSGTDTWTIVVNSNNYDINLRAYGSVSSSNFKPDVTVSNDGFGLIDNGKREATLNVKYYNNLGEEVFDTDRDTSKNMTLTLNVPDGIVNYRASSIDIVLPFSGFKYNFVLNSGSGDIKIYPFYNETVRQYENGNLDINSLKLTTTSGNFTMEGVKETAKTNTDYQDFVNYGDDATGITAPTRATTQVVLTKLEIESERGTFDFRKQDINLFNGLNTVSVKINSTRGNFYFKEFIGGFNITGDNLFFIADTIITNDKLFLYNCPNGTLDISRLDVGNNLAEIVTEYAKVDIDNLYGDISIQATYGSTNIKNTYSNVVDITTTHGDITILNIVDRLGRQQREKVPQELIDEKPVMEYVYPIGSRNGTATIRSTYGDIKVSNYYAKGWFTNKNGQININYNGTGTHNVGGNIVLDETILKTVDGYVTATGLKNKVTATATGSANITLTYESVPSVASGATDAVKNYYATIATGTLTINVPSTIGSTSHGFTAKGDFGNNSKLYVNVGSSNVYTSTEQVVNYTGQQHVNYVIFNITSTGGNAFINLV